MVDLYVQSEQKQQKVDDVSALNDESVACETKSKTVSLFGHSYPASDLFWELVGEDGFIIDDGDCGFQVHRTINGESVCPGVTVSDIGERNCIKVCSKLDHGGDKFGSLLYDVLSVSLVLNELYNGPEVKLRGPLYGTIGPIGRVDHSTGYYYVKRENAVTIDLLKNRVVELTLSGPSSIPPPCSYEEFCLAFPLVLKDKNIFVGHMPCAKNDILGGGRDVLAPHMVMYLDELVPGCRHWDRIHRERILDDIYPVAVSADIGLYCHGVWASVVVTFVSGAANNCYGDIMARPCVFECDVPLLSIKSAEECQVEPDGRIKLQRSIVAVPYYASLIITAELHDPLGNLIVSGTSFFPSRRDGSESKLIGSGRDDIKVTVTWACSDSIGD